MQFPLGMRLKTLWISLSLLPLLAALLAGSAHATKPIPPLDQMVPNEDLIPQETMTCGQLLRRVKIHNYEFSLNDELVSKMINHLLERRFYVNTATLSNEQVTVRNILATKFENPPSGKHLYDYIKASGRPMTQWVAETREGKKLAEERDDADYKRWSLDVVIQVAKDLESLGLPFDRTFLKNNSSLVGMKLAEIYGYPVRGDQIIYRTESKLNFTFEEVRWMAQLPERSPHLETVDQYLNLEWTPELVLKITRFLREEHGYHLIYGELMEDREHIENLIFEKFKILITLHGLDQYVTEYFGGWKPLKRDHFGVGYDGRNMYHVGRPDWSEDFIKSVLKFIHDNGYEPRHKLLHQKDLFRPVQKMIEDEFGFKIRGKTIYEKARKRFGTFEKACEAADVPYFEYSELFLSTRFIEDKPEFGVHEINPVILMEVLQFIDAIGFEPVEPFLESAAYELVKHKVDEAFGMDITGEQILVASKKYFKYHQAALQAADVAFYSPDMEDFTEEEPPAELVEAMGLVMDHLPEVTGLSLRHQHSNDVEQLLKEKMNFKISGHNLALWARAWGNELWIRNNMTGYRGYEKLIQYVKRQKSFLSQFISTSSVPGEEEEFLSREVVLQISKTLYQAGIFPSRSNLTKAENRERIIEVIESNFGGAPSILQILNSGTHHFDTFDEVRRELNLPYHPPDPDYSDDEILEMLRVVWDRYPGIGVQGLRVEKSTAVGKLLNRKLGVRLAGVGLLKLTEDAFGSLTDGFKAAEVDLGWYLAHGPTEGFLTEVVAYLIEQGFPVTQDNLNLKPNFSPARELLKKKFNIDIWGASIKNYARIYLGKTGHLEAIRQKAWDLVLARHSKPLLEADHLKAIVTLLNENKIFPSWKNLLNSSVRARALKLIKSEFGRDINWERIFVSSFHHFGNFDQVRTRVGLKWVEPQKVADHEILHILRLVWKKWPGITQSQIKRTHGQEVTDLILKDNPESTVTAKALIRLVQDRYGGFLEGFEAAGIDVPWTRAYPPSEDMLLDVLVLLMEKDFHITVDNLTKKDQFVEANKWIKSKFQWDVWGAAIRFQINNFYGSKGGLEIAKAKARQRLEERKKESKK